MGDIVLNEEGPDALRINHKSQILAKWTNLLFYYTHLMPQEYTQLAPHVKSLEGLKQKRKIYKCVIQNCKATKHVRNLPIFQKNKQINKKKPFL